MEKERKMDTVSTVKRIEKIKAYLLNHSPFFGYLMTSLAFLEVKDCPTMGTDGQSVTYNETYARSLSNPELLYVMVHELLHCAFQHVTRMDNRDHLSWNLAADIVTNHILEMNNIGKQPEGAVNPKAWLPVDKIKNASVEEIYRHLKKEGITLVPNKQYNFDVHGTPGEESSHDHGNQEKINWSEKLIGAADFTKNMGSLPRGIGSEIDIMTKGRVKWYRILSRYIQPLLVVDKSFSRRDRRTVHRNFILPGGIKDGITILAAIDTSGSVNDKEASSFVNETFNLFKQFTNINLHVVQCDAAVHEAKTYHPHDRPPGKFAIKGRGGTSFVPVFNYIEEKRLTIDAMIYFTDGFGTYPEKRVYPYHVYWIVNDKAGMEKIPAGFGTVIYFAPVE